MTSPELDKLADELRAVAATIEPIAAKLYGLEVRIMILQSQLNAPHHKCKSCGGGIEWTGQHWKHLESNPSHPAQPERLP